MPRILSLITSAAAALALMLQTADLRAAESATVNISVKNRQFAPSEVKAPANTPLVLRIKNGESTPVEFESVSLRVEKVVVAGGEGIIRVRPLAPGRYKFFDDFHPETRGTLVVN